MKHDDESVAALQRMASAAGVTVEQARRLAIEFGELPIVKYLRVYAHAKAQRDIAVCTCGSHYDAHAWKCLAFVSLHVDSEGSPLELRVCGACRSPLVAYPCPGAEPVG